MIRILNALREQGVTAELVKEVVKHYASALVELEKKYERYKGTSFGVPIFNRTYEHEPLTDSQINNDFFGEIIDLKVGHFAGKPASYGYDSTRPEYVKASDILTRFQVMNNLAHIDSQTTKDAAICGKAYRLLYVNPDKEIRVTLLKPYETIVLYEFEPTEVEYAFRIYSVESDEGSSIHVDVYDKYNMYEFEEIDGEYALVNERLHLFSYFPVIIYQNNDEEQGDADKVLALIDAYDETLSDMNAEISAFRLAYLAILGAAMDEDAVEAARRTGAFSLPTGTDMKFVTKSWSDSVIENHLNRIEQNIYQFSKTPNMRDDSFSGNSSGVSLKYKLSGIESKCLVFERKKTNADIRMFKVLSTIWATKDRVQFDPYSVIIQHHRNTPIDLNEIADAVSKYKGILPMEILLSLMPFIDDPQYVLDLIEDEKDRIPPYDKVGDADDLGTNSDSAGEIDEQTTT